MSADTAATPIKILVVDSERAFHDVATEAVRAIPGAELLCAVNPGEALHRLDQFVPTLIVVDGQLNGAGGINFVKRVRSKQTPIPDGTLVLFVAREFTGGLSGRLCDAGCHGIVRKPLSAKALAAVFQKMLAQPVPFVLGGAYLGPDRRAEGDSAPHEPERRRTAPRGGWTGTPPLFYRPDPAKRAVTTKRPPAWKRPPPGMPAKPTGGGLGLEGTAPAAKAPRPVGGPLLDDPLPAAAKRPNEPLVGAPLAAKPRNAAAPPLVDAPVAQPRVRNDEPLVAAAAPQPEAAPSFDLKAAVEQHRLWITTNGASGARADLGGRTLHGAQLASVNLAKANFRGTDLMGADMKMCVLVDADLRNACLAQAALNQAQLAGAKLRHADLQFAQLVECGLQASDFAGANLRGAVLTGADLAGANLLGANISGADFSSVSNLTQKQLDRATGDTKTMLPAGLFVTQA
jgi:CheY-like chemotaxis protein